MKVCAYCGSENRPTARFCIVCGRNIGDVPDSDMMELPPRETDILSQGTLLGERFKIRELINVGGMGYVYLGYDLLVQKLVAIKEMIDHFTNPEDRNQAVLRFRREANLLCNLSHPAIPKFFEYFVHKNRYYLVMDYIEGKDLRKIIKLFGDNKPLPTKKVVKWAIEICDVLEYLHSQKPPIVYRDLKPSNIIISPEDEVKLIDFGIARLFVPKVKATMVGTQGYAPPEQYRGEAEPRSDIYALGATLHHLLTGKDPQEEAPFHFSLLTEYNPNIPPPLESIIDKSLRMAPEERFESAKVLKKYLMKLVNEEGQFSSLLMEIQDIESEISALKQKKMEVKKVQKNDKIKKTNTMSQKTQKKFSWCQFRCNETRTGLSKAITNLQGRLKWRFKSDSKFTASPVIDVEGNIFLGAQDGYLYSIDSEGDLRWKFYTKDVISCSALVDYYDNIYIGSEDGYFYSIDSEGMEQWRFNTQYPIRSSPLLIRDNIFIANQDGWLYCLNSNGQKVWQFDTDEPISSSPTLGSESSIIIGGHRGGLFCIYPNGVEKWRLGLPRMITATPATASDGTIYLACEDGCLYAITPSGQIIWRFKTKGWIRSSPAISKDEFIYIASSDNFFYCIDRNGREKWRFDAEDYILSSPAISDEGMIFFASQGGFLNALNPNGKLRWWFNLNGNVQSSPAISPFGTLSIGSSDGYLYTIY